MVKKNIIKTLAIIQARMSSTRLPGKVLLDLNGKTVLERVVERVRRSELVDDVVIATTKERADLKIVELAEAIGCKFHRGSTDDVLDRYFQTARKFKPGHIVRITADCPLIDPKIIDLVVSRHLTVGADFTSNTIKLTYPDGLDIEVFTLKALEISAKEATLQSEREHLTQFMRKNPERFRGENVYHHIDLSKKRWTLDNSEDYELIKKIYKSLHKEGEIFYMNEILDFLKANPDFEKINSHIGANEGLIKSLKEDKRIR
ncbi:MAG: glycosyltransferase family protein [Candidatus Berkelbacteria bacterium]|nr:glycosyltransferase family protein [Candidatus Berkelbacteria bacterium]